MKLIETLKIGIMLAVLTLSAAVSAQDVVLRQQTGTVQALNQERGYITISGRNYGFDYEQTEIILRGERVESTLLDSGLVVRYTLDNRGQLLIRVEIIGPNNLIPDLLNN